MARTARAVVLEKQARALELVRDGCSYDEIAADLGYANRGSAWRLVQNGLRSTVDRLAEDHLGLELARLDELQAANWKAALAGDLPTARLVLSVIQARCRLLGLDAPKAITPAPRTVVITDAERAEWKAGHRPWITTLE